MFALLTWTGHCDTGSFETCDTCRCQVVWHRDIICHNRYILTQQVITAYFSFGGGCDTLYCMLTHIELNKLFVVVLKLTYHVCCVIITITIQCIYLNSFYNCSTKTECILRYITLHTFLMFFMFSVCLRLILRWLFLL